MSGRSKGWVPAANLLALGVAGVLLGFLVVRGWQGEGEDSGTLSPAGAVQEPATRPVGSGLPPLAADGGRGSSLSVVGGMSPEELARLRQGAAPSPPAGAPAVPPTVPGRSMFPAAAAPGSMAGGGPPASSLFPTPVQEAARRYLCLCGCPDNLAVCACNEQPIGAMTMLTYLEKLVEEGRDTAGLDAGMMDRYGPRVLDSAVTSP